MDLMFITSWANSKDNNLIIFSYFSKKTDFEISGVCMKSQCLFSGHEILMTIFWEKKRKYFKSCLLKILYSMLKVRAKKDQKS